MEETFSIVIPTYGRDGILCDTVESLLALADQADELILVDQTLTHDEKTTKRLAEWDREGRIRWIRHQPPGVVGAMNRGLQEAEGAIVLFLDDDIVPDEHLVDAHRQAHAEHPDAWAVVGQVIQGGNAETLKDGIEPQKTRNEVEISTPSNSLIWNNTRLKKIFLCILRVLRFPFSSQSALRKDLDFHFNGTESAWVENVMAGNLSVKREEAFALGGFDENFIPPVSYRFETEFARRIIAAGGKIRFEPLASILHLRVPSGGTRSKGSHLTSASPLHGVGDYYYALKQGKGWDRVGYMAKRPFREVCTRFHLRHPWWIPVKFVGELRAVLLAIRIYCRTRKMGPDCGEEREPSEIRVADFTGQGESF